MKKKKSDKWSLKLITRDILTRPFTTLALFCLFLFAELRKNIGQQPESRNYLDASQEYTKICKCLSLQVRRPTEVHIGREGGLMAESHCAVLVNYSIAYLRFFFTFLVVFFFFIKRIKTNIKKSEKKSEWVSSRWVDLQMKLSNALCQ